MAIEDTQVIREYMANESLQQYRDYYESDAEEAKSFEYLDNLDNRSRIRFMENFDDPTMYAPDRHRSYAMVAKREFNPELSVFSNVVLDLVDFKDRVKPMANDLALMDATFKYQRRTEEDRIMDDYRKGLQMMERYGVGDPSIHDFDAPVREDVPQSAGEISAESEIEREAPSEPEQIEEPAAA
jgi:hypothetical protein